MFSSNLFGKMFLVILALIQAPSSGAKHHRSIRSFGMSSFQRWANGKIPYTMDSSFSKQGSARIRSMMNVWEKHTCIRFVPVSNPSTEHVQILNEGRTCSGPVGYGYGRASLSERHCRSESTILHELGHMVGLHHEQERPDRRNPDSVMPNAPGWMEYNKFDKGMDPHSIYTPRTWGPYDPLSIMHYTLIGQDDRLNFIWGRYHKTIAIYRSKDPCYQQFIGQATRPSYYDIQGVNEAYGCNATCDVDIFAECEQQRLAGASEGEECFVGGNCECICNSMFPNPCRRAPGEPPKILPCNGSIYDWQCKNGRCIERQWLCDQYADCDDGEDEICRGERFCPLCKDQKGFASCDVGPNTVRIARLLNGSRSAPISCKEAVDKYPRYVCNNNWLHGPFENACCEECTRRNITYGICRDQPGRCHGVVQQWQCYGHPELWNDCPLACGICRKEECAYRDCLNGGSKTFKCTCLCPDGFTGDRCQLKVCVEDSCLPCMNGGIRLANGSCLCQPDNFGRNCECNRDDERNNRISINRARYDFVAFSCEKMKKVFPKYTCLKHGNYCCGACEEAQKGPICRDDVFRCPRMSADECRYVASAEACPFKCGLCAKEDCSGVVCHNGGTLNKDCTCSCTTTWSGSVCDKDALLCRGNDIANATFCRQMTQLNNWDSFCNGNQRFECCASCRVAKQLCVDDPDWCGPGKTFPQDWLCDNYAVGIDLGIRQKCRKMCNRCRDSEGRIIAGDGR